MVLRAVKQGFRFYTRFSESRAEINPARRVEERRVAHLLWLAPHGEHRLRVGLLIAGEQRFNILPATRCCDVRDRVMLALRRPFPSIRMPQAALEFRKLRPLLRDRGPLVEEVAIHALIGQSLAEEAPPGDGTEPLAKLLQFVGEFYGHRHDPLLLFLVGLGAPLDQTALEIDVLPVELANRTQPPSRRLCDDQTVIAARQLEVARDWWQDERADVSTLVQQRLPQFKMLSISEKLYVPVASAVFLVNRLAHSV